jgi:hypothetical protein
MYHGLLTHSPTGHILKNNFTLFLNYYALKIQRDCFQVWAITNKAVVNIYVQVFV